MNISEFLSTVLSRWKFSALITMLVVAVAVAVTITMPKRYVSTASVIVDTDKSAGAIGAALNPMQQKSYIATQIEILRSDRVAEEVARSLAPADLTRMRAQWTANGAKGEFQGWLTSVIGKSLTVSPSRESNVIEVSIKSDNGEMSARLANAFVARYVETAVEMRIQPAQKYKSFFEEQVKESRARLEVSRATLADFQKSKGILAADERVDIESTRLSELSKEVVMLEAMLAESESREQQSKRRGAKLSEVQNDPIIVGMRTDLQQAKTRLSKARQQLGSQHPNIISMQQSIADLTARIGQETQRIRSSISTDSNALRQRLAALRAATEKQRTRVSELTAARSEASLLAADVASAQRTHDDVLKRLDQTRLESQATQGNVSVLGEAKAPLLPSSPNVALNIAVGVFLGTFLGIFASILRELFDRRIRTREQLADITDLPIICSVPSFSGRKALAMGINPQRSLSGQPRQLPST